MLPAPLATGPAALTIIMGRPPCVGQGLQKSQNVWSNKKLGLLGKISKSVADVASWGHYHG